jgi:IS1 family transposase
MSNMNTLDSNRRVLVVKALCEGTSLRGTARITGVARMTVEKLLRDLGPVCAAYQDRVLRNLTCQRLQCDEIWSFCYAKAKNVTPKMRREHPDAGDVWTWVVIDADTKLVPAWFIGGRDSGAAWTFMQDVASRLKHRVQLTTDGHKPYLQAVDDAFGSDVDYATLVKIYGRPPETETRYSPATIIGVQAATITGDPNPKHISTSYVERQNLTMRMQMRRFTRLTNGFSKKLEMHAHMVAVHFLYYNFVRIHETLRVTPAMAAGVVDHVWEVADIIGLLEVPLKAVS